MNYILIISMMVLITGNHIRGQHPSDKLTSSFARAFPKAENVNWNCDNKGYNVFFKLNETSVRICYSLNEKFIEEERYYDESGLPAYITIEVKKKYPQGEIIGVTELINTSSAYYYINLKVSNNINVIKANIDGSISLQNHILISDE